MYLIVTRAFPPELGGMQSLMWGLTKEMSKNFMIKVFADYQENHKEFDQKENFSIERVGGIKFLRKIRKAKLINEFLKEIYPDIVYICIGYGDEEENIKDLVKELELGSQVMFFKDISSDLKNSLIAKSDIFVMPSIIHKTSVEGFGIAYVEAAQYGIPSLGGKDGGASDAISHDKTGLICDGNNLDDIYSSLNSMIENKKYHVLGKNAKEYVSKFQWEKIVEKYKKILN